MPGENTLRGDNKAIPDAFKRYLQLPNNLDSRIRTFTEQVIAESGATNQFDKAKAIEKYLRTNYAYSLDLKAGGDDPLSDFLFNIREGHCEYFASALAIMLRTQGIPTRVVNGFQVGEYNETAGVYIVRQKDAHSWVEVYFPKENAWVPFDATPSAGQGGGGLPDTLSSQVSKFFETIETIWIQYVVSFDNQEQRSLFKSFRNKFADYKNRAYELTETLQNKLTTWWEELKGERGSTASLVAIFYGLAYLFAAVILLVFVRWLWIVLRQLNLIKRLSHLFQRKSKGNIVEFYDRMLRSLEKKGFSRSPNETPLEFAVGLHMPQAVYITELYNEVRFGERI